MSEREKRSKEVRDFIIYNVKNHPVDISRVTAEKFGLSRVTVANHVRSLIKEGILTATGETKARRYELKTLTFLEKTLPITAETQEDEIWSNLVKPNLLGVPKNVLDICAHGFTEMFNNVIDHSESTTAKILVTRNAARIIMEVRDYGIGIFNKIQKVFNLAEPQHAILELTKGKITTDKSRHSGEGIFFTSRMFNYFEIASGTLVFNRTKVGPFPPDDWIMEAEQAPIQGTQVGMTIPTNATHTAKEIFDNYKAEFDEFGFSKTVIPLKLMRYEGEQLISRSQAKRLMAHVDKFREVILDFHGITEIGQAFADEVFRIYRREHPSVHVYPMNAGYDVIRMIKRVISEDSNDPLHEYFKDHPALKD